MNLGVPFIPVRKTGKLPGPTIKVSSTKEYGKVSNIFVVFVSHVDITFSLTYFLRCFKISASCALIYGSKMQ